MQSSYVKEFSELRNQLLDAFEGGAFDAKWRGFSRAILGMTNFTASSSGAMDVTSKNIRNREKVVDYLSKDSNFDNREITAKIDKVIFVANQIQKISRVAEEMRSELNKAEEMGTPSFAETLALMELVDMRANTEKEAAQLEEKIAEGPYVEIINEAIDALHKQGINPEHLTVFVEARNRLEKKAREGDISTKVLKHDKTGKAKTKRRRGNHSTAGRRNAAIKQRLLKFRRKK